MPFGDSPTDFQPPDSGVQALGAKNLREGGCLQAAFSASLPRLGERRSQLDSGIVLSEEPLLGWGDVRGRLAANVRRSATAPARARTRCESEKAVSQCSRRT